MFQLKPTSSEEELKAERRNKDCNTNLLSLSCDRSKKTSSSSLGE